jgi:hypothetical protein
MPIKPFKLTRHIFSLLDTAQIFSVSNSLLCFKFEFIFGAILKYFNIDYNVMNVCGVTGSELR